LLVIVGCGFNPTTAGVSPSDAPSDDASRSDARAIDAAAVDAPHSLDDGLIAHYEMESMQSNTAIDSTGNGHTGACTSCPTVVAGHSGSGFMFDGTTRVDIGDGGAFDTSAFTVATWVEYTSLSYSSFECPVGKVLDSTIYNSWELCYDMATGKWLYDTVGPMTGSPPTYHFDGLEPTSGPSTGVWHHTAMVWDGSNKTLYIDGSDVASTVDPVSFAVGMPLSFGADIDNGGQSSPFVGVMDDLRIYGRALGSAEIATLAAQ
jgi:hypothetical protein